MSEFSDAFADAFDAANDVMGDTFTFAHLSEPYSCIIHQAEAREAIRGGLSAGRGQEATLVLVMKLTDWDAAKVLLVALGKPVKGFRVTVAGDTFRLLNDPDVGYTSDTVELRLGPLT